MAERAGRARASPPPRLPFTAQPCLPSSHRPPSFPCTSLQDVKVKGVPDALRHQLQRRGVGKLAVDLVAPKREGLERVFAMMLGCARG